MNVAYRVPLIVLGRLLIVLASCGFLAWSLQRALYPLPSTDSSAHEYVVRAPAESMRNPAAAGHEAWLLAAVVDGHPVSLNTLERTGSWEDLGFALTHRNDEQPATIRVRGRRVMLSFLTSEYSGIIRVEGTSGQTDIDLFHPRRPKTTFVALDLAGGHVVAQGRTGRQDPVRTATTLTLLLLIALLWRPWRSGAATEAWALGHVAILHLLVWLTQGVGYNSDARGYVDAFGSFLAGQSSYFPPGYPLLLGPLGALFPSATGLAVTAVQHILMVLALYALARVARACLGGDLASLGLLVAGSMGPTLLLPQAILSESLAFFGMAGALWFVLHRSEIEDAEPESLRLDIAAGLLLSWAALARVSPLVSMAVPVFLVQIYQAASWPRAIRRTVRVLVTAVIVLGLSATWMWPRTGTFSIANSSGLHLYNRVVSEQLLLDREGSATRRFLSIVGDRPLKNVGHWEISSLLAAKGLGYSEFVALMGDVALEGARRHPLSLLRYSLNMAWDEYASDPLPDVPRWASYTEPMPQFENRPLLGIRASSILWRNDLDVMFAGLWPMLQWMPLAGLVFLPWLRGRLVFLALLAAVAGYLLAASFADAFVLRYMSGVVPFALVLTPVPLAGVAGLWHRRTAVQKRTVSRAFRPPQPARGR
jgi:hypothetical protein